MWILLVIAFLSGCDHCIDGVCADPGGSVARPGPCHSATSAGSDCTYSYDAAGHVTLIDCTDARTTWTWDGADVRSITEASGTTWTFDAQHVTTGAFVYDRATFAFLPLLGTRVIAPTADLGLVSNGTESFTWESSPHGLTRHSSTNEVVSYEIDDRGRITSISPSLAMSPERGTFTFRYDGDRLVSSSVVSGVIATATTFTYDGGGNLVEEDYRDAEDVMSESGVSVVYDYTCF